MAESVQHRGRLEKTSGISTGPQEAATQDEIRRAISNNLWRDSEVLVGQETKSVQGDVIIMNDK